MAHRQIEFAFLHESRAELEKHIRIVRMRGKRNLEFSNRLIESMGPEEKLANGEMGIVVPICHCQCAVPKAPNDPDSNKPTRISPARWFAKCSSNKPRGRSPPAN